MLFNLFLNCFNCFKKNFVYQSINMKNLVAKTIGKIEFWIKTNYAMFKYMINKLEVKKRSIKDWLTLKKIIKIKKKIFQLNNQI